MILRTSGIGVSIAFLREAQWGSRGREFDSRHSDHKSNDFTLEIVGFFFYILKICILQYVKESLENHSKKCSKQKRNTVILT